jgi:hypothetical protein
LVESCTLSGCVCKPNNPGQVGGRVIQVESLARRRRECAQVRAIAKLKMCLWSRYSRSCMTPRGHLWRNQPLFQGSGKVIGAFREIRLPVVVGMWLCHRARCSFTATDIRRSCLLRSVLGVQQLQKISSHTPKHPQKCQPLKILSQLLSHSPLIVVKFNSPL